MNAEYVLTMEQPYPRDHLFYDSHCRPDRYFTVWRYWRDKNYLQIYDNLTKLETLIAEQLISCLLWTQMVTQTVWRTFYFTSSFPYDHTLRHFTVTWCCALQRLHLSPFHFLTVLLQLMLHHNGCICQMHLIHDLEAMSIALLLLPI